MGPPAPAAVNAGLIEGSGDLSKSPPAPALFPDMSDDHLLLGILD
jgi:hypothetical protein